MRIYIIPGSTEQAKEGNIVSASDLYLSDQYKLCKRMMIQLELNWLIVSQVHGLIWPEMQISNYEQAIMSDAEVNGRLTRVMSCNEIHQTLAAMMHDHKLAVRLRGLEVCLLGDTPELRFAANEFHNLKVKVKTPLFGMSPQQQRAWITSTTNKHLKTREYAHG